MLNATNYVLQIRGDKSIASGFDHATRTGDNTFSIFFIDGSKVDLTIPLPKDGKDAVDITDVKDLGNGKFTLVLSDGSETSAVQTIKGEKGNPGKSAYELAKDNEFVGTETEWLASLKGDAFTYSDFTPEQLEALKVKGDDGFSPTAKVEKVGSTTTITITDKSGTTTATVKDGEGGSGGDTYTGTSAVDLGGIKNNQVFNKTPLAEVIDMLLHPYEKPTMTLGINPVKTIYDTVSETLSSITINANITKKSENIKEVRFYVDNVLVKTDTTHPTGGLVSYTHTFSPATNKTFNVKIECEDIKAGKVSANTTITFIGKSYYGYLKEGTTIDETNIKTLNTVLKKDLKYKYSAITTPGTDLYHIVLCQPKELGTITSVKDALNFEYIQDYTVQDITIDGLDYTLMYLTNPVSVTDFLQDFK